MSITLDTREKSIFKFFPESDVQIKRLDVGDIIIDYPEGSKLIIERKTIQDLQASIRDGRYREQKKRLMASGCEVWYIFEGISASVYGSVNYKAVLSAMLNCVRRDKLSVIRTKDAEETSMVIKKLASEAGVARSEPEHQPIAISMRKSGNVTQEEVYISQLCCIPGISRKLARKISEKYDSMPMLMTADEKKLMEIEKIGKKLAKTIMGCLNMS
jgi:ERCC4-type nuclease